MTRWKLETLFRLFVILLFVGLLHALWLSAQDNPGAATIEFSQANFSAPENSRFATIVIKRTGISSNAVTVRFIAAEATASSPEDFLSTNGIIALAAGQSEVKVRVPLVDDQNVQG